jgi:hypothetical protein
MVKILNNLCPFLQSVLEMCCKILIDFFRIRIRIQTYQEIPDPDLTFQIIRIREVSTKPLNL